MNRMAIASPATRSSAGLGHDFYRVKIHADSHSAGAAGSLDANGFTEIKVRFER
jgi:hypothetical protein